MAAKRETIEPVSGYPRYIRRDARGRFTSDQVSVGRSLSRDNDQRARKANRGGEGDRGDGRN